MTPTQLALSRALVSLPGFTWTAAWCLAPDDKGRVYRRNWCPDDPGFGFTQVFGRRLRQRRDTSQAVIDLRDPSNGGILLDALGPSVVCCTRALMAGPPGTPDTWWWAVEMENDDERFCAPSLAEACAAALVARGYYARKCAGRQS